MPRSRRRNGGRDDGPRPADQGRDAARPPSDRPRTPRPPRPDEDGPAARAEGGRPPRPRGERGRSGPARARTFGNSSAVGSTPYERLVVFIAEKLVSEPQAVRVASRQEGTTTVLELRVASGDVGRVIGKSGHVAESIRKVLRASSDERDARIVLKIVD